MVTIVCKIKNVNNEFRNISEEIKNKNLNGLFVRKGRWVVE